MPDRKARESRADRITEDDINAALQSNGNAATSSRPEGGSEPVRATDPVRITDTDIDVAIGTGGSGTESRSTVTQRPELARRPELPRLVRIANKVNEYMQAVPEQRRFRLYREGEGDVSKRRTVYYTVPGVTETDQHGHRRDVLPEFKGVWRNYDPDTGEPLRSFELEALPDGARVDREEAFTDADLSPYYHAAKEARRRNASIGDFNRKRERILEQMQKYPDLFPLAAGRERTGGKAAKDDPLGSDLAGLSDVLRRGVDMFRLQSPVDMQAIRIPQPESHEERLARQRDARRILGIEKGDIEETGDRIARNLVDMGTLLAAGDERRMATKDEAVAAERAWNDLADIYYHPSNGIEYYLSSAVDLLSLFATRGAGKVMKTGAPNRLLRMKTRGIIDAGGIVGAGAITDGLELVTKLVVNPVRGLVPMDTEEARAWLKEHFPKVHTGGMEDREMREMANAMRRTMTLTLENETLRTGPFELFDMPGTGNVFATDGGRQFLKGALDWMTSVTAGTRQAERDLDLIGRNMQRAFAYEDGDADVAAAMTDFMRSEQRLAPRSFGDMIWRGVGGAAPMMPAFAAMIRGAGGREFPMAETAKRIVHGVQKGLRGVPGGWSQAGRTLWEGTKDTGLFMLRSFALGLTTATQGGMKDAAWRYRKLAEQGATPAQGFVNSYLSYIAGNGVEFLTEAGHLELFRLTKRLGDGVMRKVGRGFMRMAVNEGLEERMADYMNYAFERATGLPAELSQHRMPGELQAVRAALGLEDEFDAEQIEKAMGDFVISGILGVGFGGLRVTGGAMVHPVMTARNAYRGLKNAVVDPGRSAETLAERYKFHLDPRTGNPVTDEEKTRKTKALETLIRINAFDLSRHGMRQIATSLAHDVNAFDLGSIREREGFADATPWLLSGEELRRMHEEAYQRRTNETRAETKTKDTTQETPPEVVPQNDVYPTDIPPVDVPLADVPLADVPPADVPPEEKPYDPTRPPWPQEAGSIAETGEATETGETAEEDLSPPNAEDIAPQESGDLTPPRADEWDLQQESREQLIAEDPDLAQDITRRLQEAYPQVRLSAITGESKDGRPVLGRANSRALTVGVDFARGRLDTPPHEYAHIYVDLFENADIVREGIALAGSKESLVRGIGEAYVARRREGPLTTWLKDFWNLVKSVFGREDVTRSITRSFDRAETPFSFVERKAGRNAASSRTVPPSQDEAVSFQLGEEDAGEEGATGEQATTDTQLTVTPPSAKLTNRRSPFAQTVVVGGRQLMRDVDGYPLLLEGVERQFFAAHPANLDEGKNGWRVYDAVTGIAVTPSFATRKAAVQALAETIAEDPSAIEEMGRRESDMTAVPHEATPNEASLPVASPPVASPRQGRITPQQVEAHVGRQVSYEALAGAIESGTDMQAHLERALGVTSLLSDEEVRATLAERNADGTAPIADMVDAIMSNIEGGVSESAVRAYVIKNHQRAHVPLITVTMPKGGGNRQGATSRPFRIDVAPAGTAMRNSEGQPEQTYATPPNLALLARIEEFMDAYGLAPNPNASYPVAVIQNVRYGDRSVALGELADTDPAAYRRLEEELAAEGIYMIGPGGKNDVFIAVMLDPTQPFGRRAADALVDAMTDAAAYWRERDEAAWTRSASRRAFAERWGRMFPQGTDGPMTTENMTPGDRMFGVFAALMEHIAGKGWARNGNKALKYLKELTSADRPTATENMGAYLRDLPRRIDEMIASADPDQRGLFRQVKADLRVIPPAESEVAAMMDAGGYDVLAGGMAIHRESGEVFVLAAAVDHDTYIGPSGKTPVGDGGNMASALVAMTLSHFQGEDERPRMHKPRVIKPGAEDGMLVKSMFDVFDGQMATAARTLGVGALLFDSTIKLGKDGLKAQDKSGARTPLPSYREFERTAMAGKIGLVPIRRIASSAFTFVNDPEGTGKADTALATQTWFAVPADAVHFPHLESQVRTTRDFFRSQGQRTVEAIRRFTTDAPFRAALMRRLARGSDDPAAEPFRHLIDLAGRDADLLFYVPHIQAAFQSAGQAELMRPVASRGETGSARVIGQSLKLTPDFGTATGTNIRAVLDATGGDMVKAVRYFDIEDWFTADEMMAHLTVEERKILGEETLRLQKERATLEAELMRRPATPNAESIAETQRLTTRLADTERALREREETERREAETMLLGRGWRRMDTGRGAYYLKGSGYLRPNMPAEDERAGGQGTGVPIVIDRYTADAMGWETGKKLIVTVIPTDAPHSTKSAVIVGIAEGTRHRMSWAPEHTVQLGKDHDGDAVYLRGSSEGHWRRALARLDAQLDKLEFSGKAIPPDLADLREELRVYADTGWMEVNGEHADAMWTMFADPELQSYADGLYEKFGIEGPFTEEAVDFIREQEIFDAGTPAINATTTNVVTPLDGDGRTWITANYVGATAGIIGKVANVRRRLEFFVQTYPQLVTKDRDVIDRVNMVNTILVNHAVDAPAQEHLFGYRYDARRHFEWAMDMMFGERPKDFAATDAKLSKFLALQKSRSSHGGKIATELQYAGFHLLARTLPAGSYVAAMIEPFEDLVTFGMPAAYFSRAVAPFIADYIAEETFGAGARLYLPSMIGAGNKTRPLTHEEQSTVMGMLKQAWRDANAADSNGTEDAEKRRVLRGAAQALMYVQTAMEFSRTLPTRKAFRIDTDRARDVDIKRYEAERSRFVTQLLEYTGYAGWYEQSPVARVMPEAIATVARHASGLIEDTPIRTFLDGKTPHRYMVSRRDGLMVAREGQPFVPMTPRFVEALFRDASPRHQVARQQFANVLLEIADLYHSAIDTRIAPIEPARAVRLAGDALAEYFEMDVQGDLAAVHGRLSDAVRIALLGEQFVTVRPYSTRTDDLDVYENPALRHPMQRLTYHGGSPSRAASLDVPEDADAAKIEALFGRLGSSDMINLLGFRYAGERMLARWLDGLMKSPQAQAWHKSGGRTLGIPAVEPADAAAMNDAVIESGQVAAEEIRAAIADATALADDLLDAEKITVDGIEHTATRIDAVRARVATIANLLDRIGGAVDRKVDEGLREYERMLASYVAPGKLLLQSFRSVSATLRALARLLRRLQDRLLPLMVSGNISSDAPLRDWRMTEDFGWNPLRPLFTYGRQRVRIYSNRIQDLMSYTRQGMIGWSGPTARLSHFDLVLAAMRGMGYEVSSARRQFTEQVRAFMQDAWTKVQEITAPADPYGAERRFNQAIMREMHTGELFGLRLMHNGASWLWAARTPGGWKQYRYEDLDPDGAADSALRPLLTRPAVDAFGSRAAATEALRTVMRLRRIIGENAANTLHNQMDLARRMEALAGTKDERQYWQRRQEEFMDILRMIKYGKPYFPLSYNAMRITADRVSGDADAKKGFASAARNHIEMLAASASAEYFARYGIKAGEDVAAVRDAVQLQRLLDMIAESDMDGRQAVDRIRRTHATDSARLAAAKDHLEILLEDSSRTIAGGGRLFGMDANLLHRAVNIQAVLAADPAHTGLSHDPMEYLADDVTEAADAMISNHHNGLMGSFYALLNAEHIDPYRNTYAKGARELDRRIGEVFHMKLMTQVIPWTRLVRGDEINLTYKTPNVSVEKTLTASVEKTLAARVHRIVPGRRGNRYILAARGKGGIAYLLVDPHLDTILQVDPDTMRTKPVRSSSLVISKETGLVAAHTRVRDYVSIAERLARARVSSRLSWANDPEALKSIEKWDRRMRWW